MASALHSNGVSEIYSAPRAARWAGAFAFAYGWRFDLTTEDEQGNPWDCFTKEI